VYRGIGQSIAAAVDAGRVDPVADAGTLELARSLGHAIDLAGGYGGVKREPYAFVGLSRELRDLLAIITGTAASTDDRPPWLDDDEDEDDDVDALAAV
jgi:hypothetical protein